MNFYRGIWKTIVGSCAALIVIVVLAYVVLWYFMPPIESSVSQFNLDTGRSIQMVATVNHGVSVVKIYVDHELALMYQHDAKGNIFRGLSPMKVFSWRNHHDIVTACYHDVVHDKEVLVTFTYDYTTGNWALKGNTAWDIQKAKVIIPVK